MLLANRLLGGLIRYLGKSEKRGCKYDTRKRKVRAKKRTDKSTHANHQPLIGNRSRYH